MWQPIVYSLFWVGVLALIAYGFHLRIQRNERRAGVQTAGGGGQPVVDPGSRPAAQRPAAVVSPPPVPAGAERRMPLAQWLDLVQNRLDDAPHTMIVGPTGTGKTTLVKALCASRRGDLLFVSPKPNAWPGLAYPTIDDDGGYTAIEQAMQQVLTELQRRLAAMKRGATADTFPMLTIVVDEFPTVVDECPTAPVLYRKIGQIGRELRLRLMPLTTTRQVKDLGLEGRGAARENFAEITLPRATARVSGLLQLAADEQPVVIDLEGVLKLSQQPIDPARWWTPPVATAQPEKEPIAAIAITQTPTATPLRNDPVAAVGAVKPVPDAVAQHDWLTVARLVKANVIGQTKALDGLGFPPGNGESYLAARECLRQALARLEVPAVPTSATVADTTTQRLRTTPTA